MGHAHSTVLSLGHGLAGPVTEGPVPGPGLDEGEALLSHPIKISAALANKTTAPFLIVSAKFVFLINLYSPSLVIYIASAKHAGGNSHEEKSFAGKQGNCLGNFF